MSNRHKNQSGHVLIYTVLAVSAILSTILIVSNLMIGEIRQFRNYNEMVRAYYGAETGIEKALFYLRKEDILLDEDCDLPDVDCEVQVSEQGVEEIVMDLPENQSFQIDLYDPLDFNDTVDLESMDLSWDGDGWIELSLVEWDAGAQVVWNDEAVQKFLYNQNALCNVFQQGKNYLVRLKALTGDVENLSVTIYTGENATGNEISFPQFVVVNSSGKNGNVKQKIQVELPRKAPLHGLFDYALFSEESIIK